MADDKLAADDTPRPEATGIAVSTSVLASVAAGVNIKGGLGPQSPALTFPSGVIHPMIFPPPLPSDAATTWDFEAGLTGWVATGDAFAAQPTFGDNIAAGRLGIAGGLGGDYWNVPTSIGHTGNWWVGTYEARPAATVVAGTIQGDDHTGTLTSAAFLIAHNMIDFLIGGGEDVATERIELVIAAPDYDLLASGAAPRWIGAVGQYVSSRPPGPGADIDPGTVVPAVATDATRDGLGYTVRTASGANSEYLVRKNWPVGELIGAQAWIRIIDAGVGGWCHINVDDIRFHD